MLQRFVTRGGVNLYSASWIFHAVIEKIGGRMLDLCGIVFTSVMMLAVIVRALQADGIQPWFQTIKRNDAQPSADKRSWQRRR
jgi:hypothetical protein